MRPAQFMPAIVALVLAGLLALLGALIAADAIEERSRADVARILELNGHDWAEVTADGLQVVLSGTAPDEATRFDALKAAGTVIDTARIIDRMDVTDPDALEPPRYSIEILRNDAGISLVGLVPGAERRAELLEAVRAVAEDAPVTDLLNVAAAPPPEGWGPALAYGLEALSLLPRAKISIAADAIAIKAISDSPEERQRLQTLLRRRAPAGIPLHLEISAPRPVISPYTLRFIIDGNGARFDACSTFTAEGRRRILAAARAAGLRGAADCTIGLGMPSPAWDDAVVSAIARLAELGGGSVTFSDADMTLIAPPGTAQGYFDRVVGDLKAELPEAFSLHALLPAPPAPEGSDKAAGPPEFTATLSPEGDVRLHGPIPDARIRTATESFARARFGSKAVRSALRIDEGLPHGWTPRVLAALEALARLNSGSVVMQPGIVRIRGRTGDPDARAEIARILSEKLGDSEDFRISVTYEERLDPQKDIPTPEECVARINRILEVQQITFAPGSAEIDEVARASLDNIAEVMKQCLDVPMEVGGHTDSQGREEMNLALSQARAEAVINALLARRVLTSGLTAKGYGETRPIADNSTEEGRTANRRIEFRLIEAGQETREAAGAGPEAAGTPDSAATSTATEAERTATDGTEAPHPHPQPQPENHDEQN